MFENMGVEVVGLWLGIFADAFQSAVIVVGLFTAFIAWRRYRRHIFRNKVSCTLNVIEERNGEDWLLLRGLYTGVLSQVITEPQTRRAFFGGVRRCTALNPFITMPGKVQRKDRERVIESLIMYLSTYSGIETKVAEFLGLDRIGGTKLIGVPSYEIFNDKRDHKVRPWYITDGDLRMFLVAEWADALKTEEKHHADRIVWLRAMAEIYFTGNTKLLPASVVGEVNLMIHDVCW